MRKGEASPLNLSPGIKLVVKKVPIRRKTLPTNMIRDYYLLYSVYKNW
jgi:hypothetical protein